MKRVVPANNAIEQVMTAVEAANEWGLSISTVRNACLADRFESHEARKSAGTWLVTRAAMEKIYGPRPAKSEITDERRASIIAKRKPAI
jgi:hypothetical protein